MYKESIDRLGRQCLRFLKYNFTFKSSKRAKHEAVSFQYRLETVEDEMRDICEELSGILYVMELEHEIDLDDVD